MKKFIIGIVAMVLYLNSYKLTASADAGFTKYLQEIQPEVITCTEYSVPEYSGFKSYMTYKKFSKKSEQYKLQQLAITDEHGFRRVDDYYMIAIGSYFNAKIGQRVNLILENGEEIRCVVGDSKADADTDKNNLFSNNDCLSEFLVDVKQLNRTVKKGGDVSLFPCEEWASPVVEVIVYDEYFLEG